MERSTKGKLRFFFKNRTCRPLAKALVVMICLNMTFWGYSSIAFAAEPPSLKTIPVPEPANLNQFVKNKFVAQVLGKALFWDQQVGSDGQACASCHFHAGADNRTRNQITPGFIANPPDNTFQVRGPNEEVVAADFPFHQTDPPDTPPPKSVVVRDVNDVMSSMGVFRNQFLGINPDVNSLFDLGTPVVDPVFSIGNSNTRRVEPRNTPTVINAVFNFSNFWDGRARNTFNGRNPFGELDIEVGPDHQIFVNNTGVVGGTPVLETVRIPDASLASQATGPPLSEFEMSYAGRTFPEIGKKLLQVGRRPLQFQAVHPNDSILGPLAVPAPGKGLNTTYADMIKAAFQDKFWNGADVVVPTRGVDVTYTQMEANFSLFWGLAIQLYEATLVSDDSKFDRVQEGLDIFTPEETDGMNTFIGKCFECHFGPEFTSHSVSNIRAGILPAPPGFLPAVMTELMNMIVGKAIYDEGFYNISVRPTTDDLARGGASPFVNPLTGEPFPLSFTRLGFLKADGLLASEVAQFVLDVNSPAVARLSAKLEVKAELLLEKIAEAQALGDVELVARLQARLDAVTSKWEARIAERKAKEAGQPLPITRADVDGAFKTSTIRNVELTGPYLHNGGYSTLKQVVEFYTRGGNFADVNIDNHHPLVKPLGKLRGKIAEQDNLVAFMLTLTDLRVKDESAPFDHPQLLIPSGDGLQDQGTAVITETFIDLPTVGGPGRTAQGLPPLGTFLGLSPFAQQ